MLHVYGGRYQQSVLKSRTLKEELTVRKLLISKDCNLIFLTYIIRLQLT